MPPSNGCFCLFAAGSESLWLGEPPAQAPPQLPARRVLQLGEKGSCPGGRPSWAGGSPKGLSYRLSYPSSPITEGLLWEIDQYGYRKKNTDRSKHEIVIIGESNIAGSSLTQKDMLSELLEEKLNVSVYPLAPVTITAFFKEKRFINHPPDIAIFASIERLIPHIEMPKLPRKKKSNALVSKLENKIEDNRFFQSIAVFLDRLSKGNMLNYLRAGLRRIVSNSRDTPPRRNPLLFLNGKPIIPAITKDHFDRIVQVIEGYDHLFKQRGIRFIFLPIPNQENIYYEQYAV